MASFKGFVDFGTARQATGLNDTLEINLTAPDAIEAIFIASLWARRRNVQRVTGIRVEEV